MVRLWFVLMQSLKHTVENLAQRLRRKFWVRFEPGRTQFKRDGLATFRRNLPHSERGWPCSPAVTHAFRLRAMKKTWTEI